MKSRIAILATLVVGMLLSTAGAGLAVTGFASSSDDASVAQYGRQAPDSGSNDVLSEEENNAPGGGAAGEAGDNGPGEGLQPARQVEAGVQSSDDEGAAEELPFTGFAAIPILIGGVALLSTGMILRRRTHDDA